MPESIEDLILQQDKRGVAERRPHLPVDYCTRAAQYILDHPGDVAITTGFYILMTGTPETDGPPGALAIGKALETLGRRVSYVTDTLCSPVLRDWAGEDIEVVDFPITDVDASRGPRFSQQSMAAQAATEGHGVALISSVLVADDLAVGRLVRPFDLSLPLTFAYYVVAPEAVAEKPKVAAFFDWILGEAGRNAAGG